MENIENKDLIRFRKLEFKKSNLELVNDETIPMPDIGDTIALKRFVEKNSPVLSSVNAIYIPLEKFDIYKPFYVFWGDVWKNLK